ncbi:MAG: hypothetical protein ACK5YO_19545, partial [Planctomyces sp.]
MLNRAAAQQELRPPVMAHKPGTSSTQAARVVLPLPHGRGSWLTAWSLERGAALPGGPRGYQGIFTPHPRP